MVALFANSGYLVQMAYSAASDLGMHCLQNTLLRISRLQWVMVNVMDLGSYSLSFKELSQQAHNIKMTSYQRRCDVIT